MNQRCHPETTRTRADTPLGTLIRHWRGARGRSQLDLALDIGVSQRHISFVESGRSSPSRSLLMGLADALDIPFRDRNFLLLAAGFAPAYSEEAWNSAEMRIVNNALERMLRQHSPFPAFVMDRYWNVLMTNDITPKFFGGFVDLSPFPKPRNLLRLMFDPEGLRPFVDKWDDVARDLLHRVRREATCRAVDEKMKSLINELLAYPDVPKSWGVADFQQSGPVVPIGFVKDGKLLKYFSIISTVGIPQTIAAQEFRVESMFPADEATEAWHLEEFGTNL